MAMTFGRPAPVGAKALLVMLTAFASPAYSMEIDSLEIRPEELSGVCEPIEGQNAVSLQAAVQFDLSGPDEPAAFLYGRPKAKAFQSFDCGGERSTIYYYEFGGSKELTSHLGGIKAVIWGEDGPTRMHPEAILDFDNVLVVVSSRRPQWFEAVLEHRHEFPDLPAGLITSRMKALGCRKPSDANAEPCRALASFQEGHSPVEPLSSPRLLFGPFWLIDEKGKKVVDTGWEVLFGDAGKGHGPRGSFGPIELENDDELTQLLHQLVAQADGANAAEAAPLVEFAKSGWGAAEASAVTTGSKSFAFLGMGNRIYVRASSTQIVLTSTSILRSHKGAYVVAVFPIAREGYPQSLREQLEGRKLLIPAD